MQIEAGDKYQTEREMQKVSSLSGGPRSRAALMATDHVG